MYTQTIHTCLHTYIHGNMHEFQITIDPRTEWLKPKGYLIEAPCTRPPLFKRDGPEGKPLP